MNAVQLFFFLTLQLSLQTSTQVAAQTVWAVFGFNVHGDSTPVLLSQPRELTPLGARELYNVGGSFRGRYILGGSVNVSQDTWVEGLNQHKLDHEQLKVYTTSDQYNEASALAFLQGLYPPLGNANQSYTYIDETYILSNGSILGAPLNDYQYPRIFAPSSADPESILVAGSANCDKYEELRAEYQTTSEFQEIESDNAQFYSNLYNTSLEGLMSRSMAGYGRAIEIFEYLQYGYLHNKSLESAVSSEDFQKAKVLANQYAFATNGNLTTANTDSIDLIRAIAGRTLSKLILQSLETNIQTQGFFSKMTLVFGGMEPVMAFTALGQLVSSMNSDFYGMPVPGASMVLELFSMNSTSQNPSYPDVSDLYVRFLFRNSSSTNESFTQYPLFGYSPSQIDIPFTEFARQLSRFLLPATQTWCDACHSSPLFCTGAINEGNTPTQQQLSLAGAGSIGAGITLAVVAAAAGIAWLLGFGLYRRSKSTDLGGFKGNTKMASDQDFSFAKSSNGVFHKLTDSSGGSSAAKGHERTGSWEMKDKNQTAVDNVSQLVNEEDDDDDDGETVGLSINTEPVKCHQIV